MPFFLCQKLLTSFVRIFSAIDVADWSNKRSSIGGTDSPCLPYNFTITNRTIWHTHRCKAFNVRCMREDVWELVTIFFLHYTILILLLLNMNLDLWNTIVTIFVWFETFYTKNQSMVWFSTKFKFCSISVCLFVCLFHLCNLWQVHCAIAAQIAVFTWNFYSRLNWKTKVIISILTSWFCTVYTSVSVKVNLRQLSRILFYFFLSKPNEIR